MSNTPAPATASSANASGAIRLQFGSIPVSKIWERVELGDKVTTELLGILQAKYDLEEKVTSFSLRSSRVALYEHEIKDSSTKDALGFFMNYFKSNFDEQHQYYKDFGEVLIKKTEENRTLRMKELGRHKSYVQDSTTAMNVTRDALEKAKKNWIKADEELKKENEKLLQLEQESDKKVEIVQPNTSSKAFSMSRMLSNAFDTTPEQDRERQRQKVQRRIQKLNECFNDIKVKKKALMEKIAARDLAVQQTSHHFADAELGRLSSTKSALQAFIDLEKKQLAARMKALGDLESWVSKVNIESDIKLFVKQERKIDHTHKYHVALQLLDWDYARRMEQQNAEAVADDEIDSPAITGENDEGTEGGDAASEAVTSTEDITVVESSGESNDNNVAEIVDAEKTVVIINPRLQGMQNVLSGLFADANDTKNEKEYKWELNETEWGTLLSSIEASDYFLQELDERRGRHCALNDRAFHTLAIAMKVFLDYCEHRSDVKSAMRIANMANTFHKDTCNKEYLQNELILRDHKIWKGAGFWKDALLAGIAQQMDLIESVKWDDLSLEALREVVVGVHNIIFGQLGTIAFTMHELGLTLEQVEKNAVTMCRHYQLTEDQEQELLASIRATFSAEDKAAVVGVAVK